MTGFRITGAALVLVAGTFLAGQVGQESAEVSRLRMELTNLEYRLQFETDQLRQRIERLETDLRERRAAPTPLPGIDAAGSPWSEAPTTVVLEEVSARRFVLRGPSGQTRGVLGDAEAGPFLRLYDEDGRPRISLRVEEGIGEIVVQPSR